MMSKIDRDVIAAFAKGDHRLRPAAIEAHLRNIALVGVRGNDHQRFMAEIDNPCPDLGLRAHYRELVINAKDEPVSPVQKPSFLQRLIAVFRIKRSAHV